MRYRPATSTASRLSHVDPHEEQGVPDSIGDGYVERNPVRRSVVPKYLARPVLAFGHRLRRKRPEQHVLALDGLTPQLDEHRLHGVPVKVVDVSLAHHRGTLDFFARR